MKLLIFCLAILVACTAHVHADNNWNEFIDDLLKNVVGNKDFDPLHVPDHKQEINKQNGVIHIHGMVDLFNTSITGLSHLHRNGDAIVSGKDGVMDAKLRINGEHIHFHSKANIQLGHRAHHNLDCVINIQDIDVKFQAALGGSVGIKLEQFDVDQLKHVRVKIHGFGAADPILDILADIFVAVFNRKARHLISDIIRPIIEEEIKHFHP